MTVIDPAELAEPDAYRLMTGVVVPRPIAWISTLNESGTINLAPFSCYTFIASNPVLVGIAIGRRGTDEKDTLRNLRRTKSFVSNVADATQADLVHRSAEELPPHISEVNHLRLRTTPSICIDVPRLSDVPLALECRLEEVREYGSSRTAFVVGKVERIHAREGLLRDGKIDTEELNPLGRVAGPAYTVNSTVVRMEPLQHTMYEPPSGT